MINDNRWGILYCPKHEMIGSPKRRWEKIEASLNANGVEYDFVQSESSARHPTLRANSRASSTSSTGIC